VRIVTNASPLIFLTKIGALGLLQRCFSHVLVSPAVVAETRLDLPDFIEESRLSEVGEAFVRGAIGTLHRNGIHLREKRHSLKETHHIYRLSEKYLVN